MKIAVYDLVCEGGENVLRCIVNHEEVSRQVIEIDDFELATAVCKEAVKLVPVSKVLTQAVIDEAALNVAAESGGVPAG